MPYNYLQEIAIADVAFEAWDETPDKMFSAAADALMNVMVDDLSQIRHAESIDISLEHEEMDLLLFGFLNEFIFYKDARLLLLRVSSLTIHQIDNLFSLHASLYGEKLDPARHHLNVDVKAVTLHRFAVEQSEQGGKRR